MVSEIFHKNLRTQWMGRAAHFLESVDSTQDAALALLTQGCAAGTLVVAQTQSAGRGRLDRVWNSEPGGLWASLVLPANPKHFPPQRSAVFSLVCGLAIAQAIETLADLQCRLKWPNDVWCEGKKICGILAQKQNDFLILGFGVNVENTLPSELQNQAANLKQLSSQNISPAALCAEILNQLELDFKIFAEQGFAPFYERYSEKCLWKGETVLLQEGDQTWSGTLTEINPQGELVLKDKSGAKKIFSAGEISLRRSPQGMFPKI